jgi:hypothetical protein
MPVGNVDYSGGLGRGPGLGELAQLLARRFTRGGGGGQPTAPVTGEMLSGAFGIPVAPVRDYIGPDVQGAQALVKSLLPPPERQPLPPVPMSKPMLTAGYQGGGPVIGPGDGRSDSVPALIDGGGMAQLSNDEYVIPADVVSALGRGSSAAGAQRLDRAVKEVRSGYASKLKGMRGPKAGGKKKDLGGLFKTKQDTEIELPDYMRPIAGTLPAAFEAFSKARPSGISEIAKFTPDQLAYFQRARQAANDPTGAQAAYQRGQDLLGGIYQGGDPWSDKLIEGSLAEYDRGTAIDAAGRRRAAAGRGAFGEGTQLAEVEAGREAARGRGLLGAQLREQGLTRRTQAAEQIGNLAGLERQANIGDIGLLGGIGEITYRRAQQVAEAPWQRVARTGELIRGAPHETSSLTQESPLKMMIGAAAAGASMFHKDGGRVRAGGRASHRKRAQDRYEGAFPRYADGGRIPIPRSKPKRPLPSREDTAKGLETLDRVMASQQDRLDLRMPEPYVPDTGDENEIIKSMASFAKPRPGPRGAPLHGRRQQYAYADGGVVAPGAFERIAPLQPWEPGYFRQEILNRRLGLNMPGLGEMASSAGDYLSAQLNRPDPAWMRSARGDPELLPPPPERVTAPKTLEQRAVERAAELKAAEPAPAAPAAPVTKPVRRTPARSTTTTVTAAGPAPGIGDLPERLRSPEDPITAAPMSGIKVTEAPPPPNPPPANASAEAKQSWFERWASNPLTQFGLSLMASRNPSLGGAIGEAGIAAISGAAARRREAREEQKLGIADKQAQAAADRAERADVRALRKIGLDERQAAEVAANNREQRRQAEVRLQLEKDRIEADKAYKQTRISQMAQGLDIRRQAAARVGKAGKDANAGMRNRLQQKLADAVDAAAQTGEPTPDEQAYMTRLRQQIDALGPATGAFDEASLLPEGYVLQDGEE